MKRTLIKLFSLLVFFILLGFAGFVTVLFYPSFSNKTPTAQTCGLSKIPNTVIAPSSSNVPNTQTPALFVLPGVVSPISSLSQQLDKLLETHPNRHVLLYIHGRGNQPSKAINHQLIAGLTQAYNLNTIMFTWASGEGRFPIGQALEASKKLKVVFDELNQYQIQHAHKLANTQFSLITHSMGSVVLEGFLKDYPKATLPAQLFDSIVINAASSDAKNHADWVEKIDFSDHVFVTLNTKDPMLTLMSLRENSSPLGTLNTSLANGPPQIANNTTYIDFSQAVFGHRYFVKNADQPCIFHFFNTVLNGEPLRLENQQVFTQPDSRSIFLLNK